MYIHINAILILFFKHSRELEATFTARVGAAAQSMAGSSAPALGGSVAVAQAEVCSDGHIKLRDMDSGPKGQVPYGKTPAWMLACRQGAPCQLQT